jgi:hypothetical protein
MPYPTCMLFDMQGHLLPVANLALHPSKPILATASDDKTWKLWHLPAGDLIMCGEGHRCAALGGGAGGTLCTERITNGMAAAWSLLAYTMCAVQRQCCTTSGLQACNMPCTPYNPAWLSGMAQPVRADHHAACAARAETGLLVWTSTPQAPALHQAQVGGECKDMQLCLATMPQCHSSMFQHSFIQAVVLLMSDTSVQDRSAWSDCRLQLRCHAVLHVTCT